MTQQGYVEGARPPSVVPRKRVLLAYWALAALMIAQVVSKLAESEKWGLPFGFEVFAAMSFLARAIYLTRKRILALRG